jgi:SAM-dependent methyltransferase
MERSPMIESTTALFDRLAPEYDEVLPFFAELGRLMVDWLAPGPGTRLLDLGTGRGAIAVPARARGCRVLAVDGAPGMASRLAAAQPALEVSIMDSHRLGLAGARFDAVTAGFVMHLCDDPLAAAREVRRVLRPGGTLTLSLPGPASNGSRWAFYGELVAEFEPYADPVLAPRWRPLDAPALLAQAGFAGVRSGSAEVHLPLSGPEEFWRWLMSHGNRAFVEALPAARAREFRDRVLAHVAALDPIVLDRGAVFWQGRRPG